MPTTQNLITILEALNTRISNLEQIQSLVLQSLNETIQLQYNITDTIQNQLHHSASDETDIAMQELRETIQNWHPNSIETEFFGRSQ